MAILSFSYSFQPLSHLHLLYQKVQYFDMNMHFKAHIWNLHIVSSNVGIILTHHLLMVNYIRLDWIKTKNSSRNCVIQWVHKHISFIQLQITDYIIRRDGSNKWQFSCHCSETDCVYLCIIFKNCNFTFTQVWLFSCILLHYNLNNLHYEIMCGSAKTVSCLVHARW